MDFGNSLPWTVRRPKRGMSHQKKETQLWLNVALPTPIQSEAAEAGPEDRCEEKVSGVIASYPLVRVSSYLGGHFLGIRHFPGVHHEAAKPVVLFGHRMRSFYHLWVLCFFFRAKPSGSNFLGITLLSWITLLQRQTHIKKADPEMRIWRMPEAPQW